MPFSFQNPPRDDGASHMTNGTPPLVGTFFNLPPAKNPSHWLSGEKKGCVALSVSDRLLFLHPEWSVSRAAGSSLPPDKGNMLAVWRNGHRNQRSGGKLDARRHRQHKARFTLRKIWGTGF